LAAVFSSWIVSPLQLPTPVPDGTVIVPTEPPIEKSAGVHAGFEASLEPFVIELTTAVIDEIWTAEAFVLLKFPLSVAVGPPGYRPLMLLGTGVAARGYRRPRGELTFRFSSVSRFREVGNAFLALCNVFLRSTARPVAR
jgi:hypothetical protein